MPATTRSQASKARAASTNSAPADDVPLDRSNSSRDRKSRKGARRPPRDQSPRTTQTSSSTQGGSPQRKRARTTSTNDSRVADCNPVEAGPVTLLGLPLEILSDAILIELTPIDLANLAQTNEALRGMLLSSPEGSRIWKKVKKLAGETPDRPDFICEVSWTRVIYGTTSCIRCGDPAESGAEFVAYTIMQPVCGGCTYRHHIDDEEIQRLWPDLDLGILDLIPHSKMRSPPTWDASKRYWKSHIVRVAKKCAGYEADIQSGKRGAKAAYERFKKEQTDSARAISQHAQKCYEWIHTRYQEEKQRRERRYKQVERRFMHLGYAENDIQKIKTMDLAVQELEKGDVTDQNWEHIRHALEPFIVDASCGRIERDAGPGHRETIQTRKVLVKETYEDFKRTLQPIQWLRLPPVDMIYTMPTFRSLIYNDLDAVLIRAQCDAAARELPDFISTYHDSIMAALRRAYKEMWTFDSGEDWPEGADKNLHWACSIFRTRSWDTHFFCGADDVFAQLSCIREGRKDKLFWLQLQDPEDRSQLRPFIGDSVGYAVVQKLSSTLGLDPRKALPKELDKLNRLVFCPSVRCMFMSSTHPGYGRRFDSWRTVLEHSSSYHGYSDQVVMGILCAEGSAEMLERLGVNADLQSKWSCNHCPIHLGNLQTKTSVIEHIRDLHAVTEPEESVDFFHAVPHERCLDAYKVKFPPWKDHESLTIDVTGPGIPPNVWE
ncbi:uncharacterized protein C8Q71DRAFT_861748 [Rhodofomes roseus]|uniref:F-box domain-containing protein n=1 Tax=Rhodofomes roseus TaxID=34475 RepID=A0ABQ8K3W6_9APHY|nr:uncharacterized protein C8Q71DRAFT_861748 [Rhodofomes roseus]KAH9831378.1 hypothetical protein C8Q71DRAFT_861748 [Rhodofomes roseus]